MGDDDWMEVKERNGGSRSSNQVYYMYVLDIK